MENAYNLLIEVLQNHNLATKKILFLNCNPIDNLNPKNFDHYQVYKKDYFPDKKINDFFATAYDLVAVLGTKNVKESQYFIAKALYCLKEGGSLFYAADNKENGKRLDNWFKELGLPFQNTSGHKSRCIYALKTKAVSTETLSKWRYDGEIIPNSDGFYTQAGLFAGDKIDTGSKLLTETIDASLSGHIGDFGCGYGYLSDFILKNYSEIQTITGLDIDIRALECFRLNLLKYESNINTEWVDLSKPYHAEEKFDFIIMNPPFHEGRKDDPNLGVSFIENAAKNLNPKGILWMVANTHLPYEKPLRTHFKIVDKKAEKNGFKIYLARH